MADADQVAAPTGQAVAPPTPSGQSAPAAEPYFSSGEDSFATREDLSNAWKESFMRRQDYSRKTAALARERDTLTVKQKEILDGQRKLEDEGRQYQKLRDFIAKRPDVYKELEARMRGPASPEVAMTQAQRHAEDLFGEVKPEIDGIKAELAEMKRQKEMAEHVAALKGEIPDFDGDVIQSEMERLAEGNDVRELMRTLYYAKRGQNGGGPNPEVVAADEAAKAAGVASPSAATPKSAPPSEGRSLNQIANAIKNST